MLVEKRHLAKREHIIILIVLFLLRVLLDHMQLWSKFDTLVKKEYIYAIFSSNDFDSSHFSVIE